MKINMPKMTAAQKRKREGTLLEELCAYHGYSFSDTLRESERSTMLMSRAGKKTKLEMGVVVKLIVPASGALGLKIRQLRLKLKKGKESVSAKNEGKKP